MRLRPDCERPSSLERLAAGSACPALAVTGGTPGAVARTQRGGSAASVARKMAAWHAVIFVRRATSPAGPTKRPRWSVSSPVGLVSHVPAPSSSTLCSGDQSAHQRPRPRRQPWATYRVVRLDRLYVPIGSPTRAGSAQGNRPNVSASRPWTATTPAPFRPRRSGGPHPRQDRRPATRRSTTAAATSAGRGAGRARPIGSSFGPVALAFLSRV